MSDTNMREDINHPIMDDLKVFLVKLPKPVYLRLMSDCNAPSTTDKEGPSVLGEIIIDLNEDGRFPDVSTMLLRDIEGKRQSLRLFSTPLDEQDSLLDEKHTGREAVVKETVKSGRLKLACLVNERLKCVPKHYKVGESSKQGFFRCDQVTINKVDIDLAHQLKPYIYELRDEDNDNASDDDEIATNYGAYSKKGIASTMDHNKKAKRVTLSKRELEYAVFQLFKEKPEYKLSELEDRLNHPRNTLKAALKSLCMYDYTKRVYTMRHQ